MVKFFTNWHIFKFPWESVTNVWWQKYPNPSSLQVDSVDVLDRSVDKTGTLITRRLISASINTPAWMIAVGFPYQTYVIEESRVNPFKKEMELRSRNVTGADLLVIQETCKYTQCKNNPQHTRYDQTAEITAFVPIVSSKIESYSLSIQSENAFKGLATMENLCERWVREGMEGFEKILNMRLDIIMLTKDLNCLRERIANLKIEFQFGKKVFT